MLKNPETGGTPANDIKDKIIDIDVYCKLYTYFNSLSVFIILVLNKKNIKNKFNVITTYTTILNNMVEKIILIYVLKYIVINSNSIHE